MAAVAPAHLTLAYPEEFGSDYTLLLDRIEDIAKKRDRFWISIVGVVCENEGKGGVFLKVVDSTNSWSSLRESILVEPFRKLEIFPHVTLVHPRTSDRGPEAWIALRDWKLTAELQVRDICFTETSDHSMVVLETFSLR